MSTASDIDFDKAKADIAALAEKGGALVTGIAGAEGFDEAPAGRRPADLLPRAKCVVVLGGAQPRAGDWQSPNYQHMEVTTTSDRVHTLALKVARMIEDRYGYYAVCVPPGVDRGQQPFLSIAMAAHLAGCGSRSLAGPILHPDYGFMYYGAIVTTMPLPANEPLDPPACPTTTCIDMFANEGTTPCMSVCPIENDGCIGGKIEKGRFTERRFEPVRCATRVQNYWVPGFQKVLEATLQEPDKEKQKMMLFSSMFTRTLWSMTYSNVSQGQCAECMRVCPVGQEHRRKR